MPTLTVSPLTPAPGETMNVDGAGFDPKVKFALTTVSPPTATYPQGREDGITTNTNRPRKDGTFKVGINAPPIEGAAKVRAYQPSTGAGKTMVAEVAIQIKKPVVVEPVPEPTPGTNPSGVAMPLGNIPSGITPTNAGGFEWIEVHKDDFNIALPEGSWPHGNAAVDAAWDYYPKEWHDTSGNGWYGNRIISTGDSVMRIRQRFVDGQWKSAAPIPVPFNGTVGGTSFRVESRFKVVTPGMGFGTAWLGWPTNNIWPRDGEWDGPEGQLWGQMDAYLHRQNATWGGDQDIRHSGKTYTSWHTWISEWIMGTWWAVYCDGQILAPGPVTARVPSTPMRYVMQTETRLSGGPPPSGAEALIEVDWVKCYRKAGTQLVLESPADLIELPESYQRYTLKDGSVIVNPADIKQAEAKRLGISVEDLRNYRV